MAYLIDDEGELGSVDKHGFKIGYGYASDTDPMGYFEEDIRPGRNPKARRARTIHEDDSDDEAPNPRVRAYLTPPNPNAQVLHLAEPGGDPENPRYYDANSWHDYQLQFPPGTHDPTGTFTYGWDHFKQYGKLVGFNATPGLGYGMNWGEYQNMTPDQIAAKPLPAYAYGCEEEDYRIGVVLTQMYQHKKELENLNASMGRNTFTPTQRMGPQQRLARVRELYLALEHRRLLLRVKATLQDQQQSYDQERNARENDASSEEAAHHQLDSDEAAEHEFKPEKREFTPADGWRETERVVLNRRKRRAAAEPAAAEAASPPRPDHRQREGSRRSTRSTRNANPKYERETVGLVERDETDPDIMQMREHLKHLGKQLVAKIKERKKRPPRPPPRPGPRPGPRPPPPPPPPGPPGPPRLSTGWNAPPTTLRY